MLTRFLSPKGLVLTVDLSKIAGSANPRTVEAPLFSDYQEPFVIDWGDGTSDVVDSFTQYPAHTYSGTETVYRITIRSLNGRLPNVRAYASSRNITAALVSVDYFNGSAGNNQTLNNINCNFQNCSNVKYVDPRSCGQWNIGNLASWFQTSGLSQPIESFCFDFCDSVTTISGLFNGSKITGTIPPGLFDNCKSVTSVRNAFKVCFYLPPPPLSVMGEGLPGSVRNHGLLRELFFRTKSAGPCGLRGDHDNLAVGGAVCC